MAQSALRGISLVAVNRQLDFGFPMFQVRWRRLLVRVALLTTVRTPLRTSLRTTLMTLDLESLIL